MKKLATMLGPRASISGFALSALSWVVISETSLTLTLKIKG